jgi:hypothetical protein
VGPGAALDAERLGQGAGDEGALLVGLGGAAVGARGEERQDLLVVEDARREGHPAPEEGNAIDGAQRLHGLILPQATLAARFPDA